MKSEITDWKELSRKPIYKKFRRGIDEVVFRTPDGKESLYAIKNEGLAAGILAITKDKQVILAKQFRPGPKKVLLEIPGGEIDPADDHPLETVRRELLEETGYAGKIEFVTKNIDDAYSNSIRSCFVAVDCVKVADQKLDDTEWIEVVLMPLDEFREHLRSGQLTDTEIGYLGLDYLNLL